jgi:hypothetical protein
MSEEEKVTISLIDCFGEEEEVVRVLEICI